MKILDHEEKIHALTLVIKSICEENNLSKRVIIEDFIDLMEKEKPPENYSKGVNNRDLISRVILMHKEA